MAVDLYSTALIALVVVFTGVLSIRFHISSSILEAVAGIAMGSFLGVRIEPWLDFLATFGSLMLTFLAGAEVDLSLLEKKRQIQLYHRHDGFCRSTYWRASIPVHTL